MNIKCLQWVGLWILGIIMSVQLTACSTPIENLAIDTTNIVALENVRTYPVRSTSGKRIELGALRIKMLEDSAMAIAAQAGLSWASQAINAKLEFDRKYLDTIYNFNAMMLTHGVIPPVLVEGDFTLNLDDPNTIRVSDRTYKIIKQARFATTPPNWREYLWLAYSKPDLPDRSLLPRTTAESRVWKRAIRAGWDKGIEQSFSIFQQSLARLKRDYKGMVLYRKLLHEKMISPPFVARTELGITGDGTDMHINDQVLRIVELPKLQVSGRHWRAVVVPGGV